MKINELQRESASHTNKIPGSSPKFAPGTQGSCLGLLGFEFVRCFGVARHVTQIHPHTLRVNPPSTRKFCPVIYAAPSDNKNATVAAISSTLP